MDRHTCGQIRQQMQAQLNKFGKGLVCEVGAGRYDSSSVVFKVEVRQKGAPSREQQTFKSSCQLVGLNNTDLNKVFTSRGVKFKIVGLSLGRPKNPIIAARMDSGKQYVFPVDVVRLALGRKPLGR